MKKITTLLLTLLLLTTYVHAEIIYENKTSEVITKGVVLESIDTYTDSGWQRVDVVKIDLTDKDLEIKVLSPENGVSARKTVKQLAEAYNTKAAINGDFFNMVTGDTNMLGMVISDGQLISTPSKDNFASFALTDENSPIFDYFTFTGTLFAENTSLVEYSYTDLYQINKVPITTGGITMLTDAWGNDVDIPIGNYAMITESCGEGKYEMSGFSWGGEPVAIPKGGAVFTTNYNINGFLNSNFAIGDTIRVETTLSPDASAIKESLGGNTLLVKEGEVCSFTSNITGKNPRTALGVSESEDTLYFVTVDGRKSDCPGFTQEALAKLMIELGCYTAINLDGGGSTTMVVEDKITGKQKVENNITSLRSVSNGIGVISNLSPLKDAESGDLILSAETIVAEDSINVTYAFYDKNHNKIAVDAAKITTTDEKAVISGNKITFKTPGEHFVYASYQKVTVDKKIMVLGDIFSIDISPDVADVTKNDGTFTVTAYDQNGHSAQLPPSIVEFITSDSIKMSGNKVLKTTNSGTVTAKYKGLTANAVINAEKHLRDEDIKEKDIYEGLPENSKAITFAGKINPPENLISIHLNKNYLNSLASAEDLYCISSVYDNFNVLKDYKKADTFSLRTIENSKIVTFPSGKSNSIRLSGADNWKNIIAVCNNSTEKNIVFVTNSPMYKLDTNEKSVWNHYINILTEKGKKVFVISPGERSEVKTENGIRYLYVGEIGNCSIGSFEYNINQSKPLTVYFSGDEIYYEFK